MIRLFIAAWPGDAALKQLSGIDRPDEAGVRWLPEPNLHVTLRYLGSADADQVIDRLTGVELPRATARLGSQIEPLPPGQIVVPVSGIDELATAIRLATADLGEPALQPFLGHLTLARLRKNAATSLYGSPIDAEFEITEIAVVASELSQHGAEYTTITTIPTG